MKRLVVTTNATKGCRRPQFVAAAGRVGQTFTSNGAEQSMHVSVIGYRDPRKLGQALVEAECSGS